MMLLQCAFTTATKAEMTAHAQRMHEHRVCDVAGCDFSAFSHNDMSMHKRGAHRARCGICSYVPGRGKTLDGHKCEEHIGQK
jgi:hypothetical protein